MHESSVLEEARPPSFLSRAGAGRVFRTSDIPKSGHCSASGTLAFTVKEATQAARPFHDRIRQARLPVMIRFHEFGRITFVQMMPVAFDTDHQLVCHRIMDMLFPPFFLHFFPEAPRCYIHTLEWCKKQVLASCASVCKITLFHGCHFLYGISEDKGGDAVEPDNETGFTTSSGMSRLPDIWIATGRLSHEIVLICRNRYTNRKPNSMPCMPSAASSGTHAGFTGFTPVAHSVAPDTAICRKMRESSLSHDTIRLNGWRHASSIEKAFSHIATP